MQKNSYGFTGEATGSIATIFLPTNKISQFIKSSYVKIGAKYIPKEELFVEEQLSTGSLKESIKAFKKMRKILQD